MSTRPRLVHEGTAILPTGTSKDCDDDYQSHLNFLDEEYSRVSKIGVDTQQHRPAPPSSLLSSSSLRTASLKNKPKLHFEINNQRSRNHGCQYEKNINNNMDLSYPNTKQHVDSNENS